MKEIKWKAGDVCYVAFTRRNPDPKVKFTTHVYKSIVIVQDGVPHTKLPVSEEPYKMSDVTAFRTKGESWMEMAARLKRKMMEHKEFSAEARRRMREEDRLIDASMLRNIAYAKKQAAKCKAKKKK